MRAAVVSAALLTATPFAALAYGEPSWSDIAAGPGPSWDPYVSAVISAAEYANRRQSGAGMSPVFCAPPGGVSVLLVMAASRDWVERNPGFRLFPAPYVIYAALHDTYPCPTS